MLDQWILPGVTLLSDPIVVFHRIYFLCRYGKRQILCISHPDHAKLDAVFLKYGDRIKVRGSPVCLFDGVFFLRVEGIKLILNEK